MASAAEQLAANFNFSSFGKATELRQRILFTLGALIVARLGTYIPMPGIDPAELARQLTQQSGARGYFVQADFSNFDLVGFAAGMIEKHSSLQHLIVARGAAAWKNSRAQPTQGSSSRSVSQRAWTLRTNLASRMA